MKEIVFDIIFNNDTHAHFHTDVWNMSTHFGVETLVIGHGLPRKHVPLCNVKYFEISEREINE